MKNYSFLKSLLKNTKHIKVIFIIKFKNVKLN
jgi:hypothetical protein